MACRILVSKPGIEPGPFSFLIRFSLQILGILIRLTALKILFLISVSLLFSAVRLAGKGWRLWTSCLIWIEADVGMD